MLSQCRELTDFGRDLSPASFPRLHCLVLNYSAKLTYLSPLMAVRELSLAGSPATLSLLRSAGQLHGLTRLDLSCYSPANAYTHQSVAQLTGLTSLGSLNLGGASKLMDEHLEFLTHMQRLSELDLNGCSVTNKGLEGLARLGSLQWLRCSRCSHVRLDMVQDEAIRMCLYRGHRREGPLANVLLQ